MIRGFPLLGRCTYVTIASMTPGDDSSSEQRAGLSRQAIEDYLKTIYSLSQTETPVGTSQLAEARHVKPASATGMIKRLAELRLVNYERHRGVTLTPAGEKIALEVIRHHRLLEAYLTEALGFTWDEVHEQADVLEHVISEKLEERIAAALGHPQFDPHGAPIPAKSGAIPHLAYRPLTALAAGEQARVARIAHDDDSDLLRYLAELGLVPGVMVRLTGNPAEQNGPLTVSLDGQARVVNRHAAQTVLVELGTSAG